MIEINNLTKIYKLNKKQMKESKTTNPLKTAVDDLSLRAVPGEIYGLLCEDLNSCYYLDLLTPEETAERLQNRMTIFLRE